MSVPNAFRIMGADLVSSKRVVIALQSICGVGKLKARTVCAELGLNPNTKVHMLSKQIPYIRKHIEINYPTRTELDRQLAMNINHKIQIGSYQGIRHAYCQPVHGQRNRTNGKTAKKLARQRAAQLGLNIVRAQAKSKHPQKRK